MPRRFHDDLLRIFKDSELFHNTLSIPLSSVLNTFLMWSLIRGYLPFLSKGYRNSLEYFEKTLYGIDKSPPNWYFCTKLVKLWMPLAVDVLQNYPNIQKVRAIATDIIPPTHSTHYLSIN